MMNNLRFIDAFNGTHASRLQTPIEDPVEGSSSPLTASVDGGTSSSQPFSAQVNSEPASKEEEDRLRRATDRYHSTEKNVAASVNEHDEALEKVLDSTTNRLDISKMKASYPNATISHNIETGSTEIAFGVNMKDSEIETVMALQESAMRRQGRDNEEETLNSTKDISTHVTPDQHMASLAVAKMRLGLPAHFGSRCNPHSLANRGSLMATPTGHIHRIAHLMGKESGLRTQSEYQGAAIHMQTLVPNEAFIRMRTDLFSACYDDPESAALLINKCTNSTTILAMVTELKKREKVDEISFNEDNGLDKGKIYFETITHRSGDKDANGGVAQEYTVLHRLTDPKEILNLQRNDPKKLTIATRTPPGLVLKIALEDKEKIKDIIAVACKQAGTKESKGEALKKLYEAILDLPPSDPNQGVIANVKSTVGSAVKGSPAEKFLASMTPDQVKALMTAYAPKSDASSGEDLTEHKLAARQIGVLNHMLNPRLSNLPLRSWQMAKHFNAAVTSMDPALLQAVCLNEPHGRRLNASVKQLQEEKHLTGGGGSAMQAFFKTPQGKPLTPAQRSEVYFDTLYNNAMNSVKKARENVLAQPQSDDQPKLAFQMEFLRTQVMAQPLGDNDGTYKTYSDAKKNPSKERIGAVLARLLAEKVPQVTSLGDNAQSVLEELDKKFEQCSSKKADKNSEKQGGNKDEQESTSSSSFQASFKK